MKTYRCDKCGAETKIKINPFGLSLWELRYNSWEPIADLCDNCRIEFDKLINQFFGKEVIKVGHLIKDSKEKEAKH